MDLQGAFTMASTRERMLVELMATLTSSLNQKEVLGRFYDGLSRHLVPADYAAFCVSKPGPIPGYDWDVAKMPEKFFASYAELAEGDFVRRAVMEHPNTVLSDSEMLSRQELKNSQLYAHCRAMGMPLEHVMAVLLNVKLDWHGGVTLYREGERPFSEQERMDLQCLTPLLASTVRNCRLMAKVAHSPQLVDALHGQEDFECIVVSPPAAELMRTAKATELLARWFSRAECNHSGLPIVMLGQLTQLSIQGGAAVFGHDMLVREKEGRSLVMTFVPLPRQEGRQLWALVLQEDSIVPQPWRTVLTETEMRVTEGVLQGYGNKTIAELILQGSENTVKTHLKKIFAKLNVESRAQLMSTAEELNAGRRLWRNSWAWSPPDGARTPKGPRPSRPTPPRGRPPK
jgi:DNA-binding CsgD family transcriptional regulator